MSVSRKLEFFNQIMLMERDSLIQPIMTALSLDTGRLLDARDELERACS